MGKFDWLAAMSPGYYDLPGARMLPGGRLAVSPSQGGAARSMPGVDMPVVGYSQTGWNANEPLTGDYQYSIPGAGLPIRRETGGGGLTPFDPMGYGDKNPAQGGNVPLDDILSFIFGPDRFYRNDTPPPSNYVPPSWLQDQGYPDLSNAPPVIVSSLPGGGMPQNAGGNWRENARTGYQPWERQAMAAAAAAGYGPGNIAQRAGGEWSQVSADVLGMLGGNMRSPFLPGGGARMWIN